MADTWECLAFIKSNLRGLDQVGPGTNPRHRYPFRTGTHPRLSLISGVRGVSLSSRYASEDTVLSYEAAQKK